MYIFAIPALLFFTSVVASSAQQNIHSNETNASPTSVWTTTCERWPSPFNDFCEDYSSILNDTKAVFLNTTNPEEAPMISFNFTGTSLSVYFFMFDISELIELNLTSLVYTNCDFTLDNSYVSSFTKSWNTRTPPSISPPTVTSNSTGLSLSPSTLPFGLSSTLSSVLPSVFPSVLPSVFPSVLPSVFPSVLPSALLPISPVALNISGLLNTSLRARSSWRILQHVLVYNNTSIPAGNHTFTISLGHDQTLLARDEVALEQSLLNAAIFSHASSDNSNLSSSGSSTVGPVVTPPAMSSDSFVSSSTLTTVIPPDFQPLETVILQSSLTVSAQQTSILDTGTGNSGNGDGSSRDVELGATTSSSSSFTRDIPDGAKSEGTIDGPFFITVAPSSQEFSTTSPHNAPETSPLILPSSMSMSVSKNKSSLLRILLPVLFSFLVLALLSFAFLRYRQIRNTRPYNYPESRSSRSITPLLPMQTDPDDEMQDIGRYHAQWFNSAGSLSNTFGNRNSSGWETPLGRIHGSFGRILDDEMSPGRSDFSSGISSGLSEDFYEHRRSERLRVNEAEKVQMQIPEKSFSFRF